jgi:hypothetical protein
MSANLRKDRASRLLAGPSIQIDPTFPYYLDRSETSIAEELDFAGYSCVHYFVTNEFKVNRKLIDAFHARGIPVWALVLGNGSFSTEGYPTEWPQWQMQLLRPVKDGYVRLSPHCAAYVTWKKKTLVHMLIEMNFDGLEIAEPYLPEWNGLSSGTYGDIGPHAQAAFSQKYQSPIPEFRNPFSRYYYKNNKQLYHAWVKFRTDSVNSYIDEIINGKDGVREARPDLAIATWTLAIAAGPYSVELLRELQGNDAVAMIAKVRPDLHYLQTHWPDWQKPSLPGEYPLQYQAFIDEIRSVYPFIPLGIQADIGSDQAMKRDRNWLNRFSKTAFQLGFQTWTAYEYHISKLMAEEPPLPIQASRLTGNRVLLSFNKRIDKNSVQTPGSFYWSRAEYVGMLKVTETDGNRVILHANDLPMELFQLFINHVKDTPDLWLYKGSTANQVPPQCSIIVPTF